MRPVVIGWSAWRVFGACYSGCMSRVSPTLEGFRAAFRRPSLTLAEITWRWTVGATASIVLLFGLVEYLSTLPVSNADLLLLASKQPVLIGRAFSHILRGTMGAVAIAGAIAGLSLICLWIVFAALGRIATVRGLRDYFRARKDIAGGNVAEEEMPRDQPLTRSSFRALAGLNFLRAALVLASATGLVGAAILAGFASPEANPRPGVAFLLFLPLAGAICLLIWVFNWILSLAGIFAVRDGGNTLGALSTVVSFCSERLGAIAAVSVWFGLIRLVVFLGATTVILMPMGFAAIVPVRLVILAMLLLTLAYLAIADWLYLARLAGYVCIAEMPEPLFFFPPLPLATPPTVFLPTVPQPSGLTTIDRDEPILSDVPLVPGP
jgi:hypothetical protein